MSPHSKKNYLLINVDKEVKKLLFLIVFFSISFISTAEVLNSNLSPNSNFKKTANKKTITYNSLDYSLVFVETLINNALKSIYEISKSNPVFHFFSDLVSLVLRPSETKNINVTLSPDNSIKNAYPNDRYTLNFKTDKALPVTMTVNEFNKKIIPLGYYIHLGRNRRKPDYPKLYFFKIIRRNTLPRIYSDSEIEVLYVNRLAFFQRENLQAFVTLNNNRMLFQLQTISEWADVHWRKASSHGLLESKETVSASVARNTSYHETAHIINPYFEENENIPEKIKSGQAPAKQVMDELLAELQVLTLGGINSRLLLLEQESLINYFDEKDEHHHAALWLIGELLGLKDPFNWNYVNSLTVESTISELLSLNDNELKNRAFKIIDTYFPNANILGSLKITQDDIHWRDLRRSLKTGEYGITLIKFLKSLTLTGQEQKLVQAFTVMRNSSDTDENREFTQAEKTIFLQLLNTLMKDPTLSEKLAPYKGLFIFGEKKLYSDAYLKEIAGNLNLNLMASAFYYFLTDTRTMKMERIDTLLKQNEFPSELTAVRQIIFPRIFNSLSFTSKKFILNIYNQVQKSA